MAAQKLNDSTAKYPQRSSFAYNRFTQTAKMLNINMQPQKINSSKLSIAVRKFLRLSHLQWDLPGLILGIWYRLDSSSSCFANGL